MAMKSPWIISVTLGYCVVLFLANFVHCEQNVILWTQRSAIWSHIRGVSGDVRRWLGMNSTGAYNYVRGESQEHTNLIGISYDHVTQTVCWSEAVRHGLYCQPLNYTASRSLHSVKTIVEHNVLDIQDISIDWETGNVYFAAKNFIGVAPSKTRLKGIYKHLLSNDFEAVSGVVVDPKNNFLFWTDAAKATIGRSTLAGKSKQNVYTIDRGNPLGITVVPREKRVFWVDNAFGNLESSDYDGLNFRRHIQDRSDQDFMGLAFHAGFVFITGRSDLRLYVYNTTTSDPVQRYKYVDVRELDATPHYITAMDTHPMKPPHECDTMGCEHICLNLGSGRGECTCKNGFYLKHDQRTCTETSPRYVYTTGKEVLMAVASFQYSDTRRLVLEERPLLNDRDDVRALAFHYGKNKLYFSDVVTDVIYRCEPDGSQEICEEHTVNTRRVLGIAVDWMTSHVYWSDFELGHIMVSQLDGRYHSILIENGGKPTGIAIDARQRRMFWNDVHDGKERIITSNLNGLEQNEIVDYSSGIMHPQGLFVDPHKQRLYWVDQQLGEIECVDYFGRNRVKILQNSRQMMYDVTLYQDLTTWSDAASGLRFRSTITGEDIPLYRTSSQTVHTQTYDVIAFDPYLQPQGQDPCSKNNGDCQQLCFGTPEGTTTCGCAIGFSLNEDGRSCDTVIREEYFIIYTDPYHKQVYQTNLSLENAYTRGLPLPLMDQPISVDYDAGRGRVFWIDLARKEFKRSNMDGSDESVLRAIPVGSHPMRIAVDPRNGFLYYTDWERGTVSKMTLTGDDHEDVITGLDKPVGVAVDYKLEILAWTSVGLVEMSDVTGENRRRVADSVQQPAAVSLLPGENMLFFVENVTGTIYAYNITNNARSEVFRDARYQIISVAVSPDHLYFSAHNDKAVNRLDRFTGQNHATVGSPVFARVTDIKVVQERVEPNYSEGGFSWIILAGALAGLLLLALTLLAALLGVRRVRQKRAEEAATDAESGGAHNDVDREYAYLDQSRLFDIRGSHEAMNGTSNGTVSSGNASTNSTDISGDGSASTGFDNIDANNVNDNTYTEEPISNGIHANSNGIHSNGNGIHVNGVANGMNGTNGIPTGGVAAIGASTDDVGPAVLMAVAAGKTTKYNKNNKTPKTKKKKTLPKDPEFEFSADNKVATRIQRLANRLRNRLSSVRWSSGGGDTKDNEPVPDHGEAPVLQAIGPEKTGPDPKGRKVHIPPKLHQMPRGFAPASHCKPSHVRKSLNALKAKNMLERTDSGDSGSQ